MGRTTVTVRDAVLDDAPILVELWSDALRRADPAEQTADMELVIKAAAVSPEQRFVVAEFDGHLAGGVFLRLMTVSPLNLEPCVQAVQPRVFDQFHHHGVGRALMDAGAAFAEDNGVVHMTTVVPSASRESQRFMARLGLAPIATYRTAPVSLVRSRLTPTRSGSGLPRVLAARRQRRARDAADRTELPFSHDSIAPERP